jgi:gluconokinase
MTERKLWGSRRTPEQSKSAIQLFFCAWQGGSLVILLMGVSGAGKTTVGQLLAARVGCEFADADDYHSAANVAKMHSGVPLTDADREPWLETLRALITGWIAAKKTAVLACSALKQSYRDRLRVTPEVQIVYLKVSQRELRHRLRLRQGHFMTEAMLDSQLATLEQPEGAILVDGERPSEEIVVEIIERLRLA